MNGDFKRIPAWRLLTVMLVSLSATAHAAPARPAGEVPLTGVVERYVVIDNVCAWPNLTVLRDGTIVAAIFNRPSHGLEEGSVEAWASPDGRFWEKRGVPAPNDPSTNRMNIAAGLAGNGDLIVLCSGWKNLPKPGQSRRASFSDSVLSTWVCRSSDGGRTWTQSKDNPEFSPANTPKGWSAYVPFGDILPGADGALHTTFYTNQDVSPETPKARPVRQVWHFRSDDDGRTWRRNGMLSPDHNETSLLHLQGKNWLAVARQTWMGGVDEARPMRLFRSSDDGETWTGLQNVTGHLEINVHLIHLRDGRILMTYGNRVEGAYGVLAKFSSDEGRTWSVPIRLADSAASDCGYPSSVQRPDGTVVTAHYTKKATGHTRYHMAVVIWTPPGTSL